MKSEAEFRVYLVFAACALPMSVIDVREWRIPDALSFCCFFLVLAVRAVFLPETLALSLWASFGAFALFALVRAASPGLGAGDLKLAAVMGLVSSFPRIIGAILGASALALGAIAPAAGKTGRGTAIPFAPFLCAGTLLAGFF